MAPVFIEAVQLLRRARRVVIALVLHAPQQASRHGRLHLGCLKVLQRVLDAAKVPFFADGQFAVDKLAEHAVARARS